MTTDQRPARIRVNYYKADRPSTEVEPLLAAVHFGPGAGVRVAAPLAIDVHLSPLNGSPHTEGWAANGAVRSAQSGRVRYAYDDHFLFGVLEQDERGLGGIRATAASVYDEMQRFQRDCAFPHLLRVWNYLDAINEGAGDLERYREFCVGRALGLGPAVAQRFPAATAIGRQQPTGQLQVFWLAARTPGAAIENPRQVSAYLYPRMHGPASPTFSRATATPDGAVLISGTASIVGHASHHHDDPLEQLEETLRNLEALTGDAPARGPAETGELFKVYVRNPAHTAAIERRLRESYPASEAIFLAADICRRELLVEIEGVRLR